MGLYQVLAQVYQLFKAGDRLGSQNLLKEFLKHFLELPLLERAEQVTAIDEWSPLTQSNAHLESWQLVGWEYLDFVLVLCDGFIPLKVAGKHDDLALLVPDSHAEMQPEFRIFARLKDEFWLVSN